jgi:aminopeptidase N
MAKIFGDYPYKTFTIIQGSDGATEYPMAAMMRTPGVVPAVHEWMHSWFHGVLATNETLYPWMDEGFSNYAEHRILALLRNSTGFAQAANYNGYFNLVRSGLQEPAATPADHFSVNYASASTAYHKGAVFLSQLGYIVGDAMLDKVLLKYYDTWKFKHPTPNDFIRVAEKTSGITLQWYKDYWINTIKTVDYGIDSLWQEGSKLKLRIRRVGEVPMPVDVQLIFKSGDSEVHNIPSNLMYGAKKPEDTSMVNIQHEPWPWTHPTYVFETDHKLFELTEVHIDPSQRMADVQRRNNVLKIQW